MINSLSYGSLGHAVDTYIENATYSFSITENDCL